MSTTRCTYMIKRRATKQLEQCPSSGVENVLNGQNYCSKHFKLVSNKVNKTINNPTIEEPNIIDLKLKSPIFKSLKL